MKHHSIKIILVTVAFFVCFLIYRLVNWASVTLAGLTFDKIVFELNVPLEGTSSSITGSAIQTTVYPALATALFLMMLLFVCDRSKNDVYLKILRRRNEENPRVMKIRVWPFPFTKTVSLLVSLSFLFTGIHTADREFGLAKYVSSQIHTSTFIEKNYVDPLKVNLTFPTKKRNLIYIYMESMESSYEDHASGGVFSQNLIPELTDLARNNTSFSNTSLMGGTLPVYGTQWTMGAMFSHSTGLPLNLPIDGNAMSSYAKFFPGVTSVGDILEKNGYHNVLFFGSDATFGGRKQFYSEHGNFEIDDYYYAIKRGWIPSNYFVWWGYEDQKLFAFAKQRLTELSKSNQPFDFTMLTADTHFQDGYVCNLCQHQFPSQYANVIACSSRQVTEFVNWIQQQDFYQNTTIILTGDHETMQSGFISENLNSQRSVYNCFINTVPKITAEQEKNRKFCSFDFFPTTLASIGVQVDGDRLGLGVNLFSGKQTLMEKYGDKLSEELSKKSVFYNKTFIYAKKAN